MLTSLLITIHLTSMFGAYLNTDEKFHLPNPFPMTFKEMRETRWHFSKRSPDVQYQQDWVTVQSKRDPKVNRLIVHLYKNGINFDQFAMRFFDNSMGFLSSIQRTENGGFIVFGQRGKGKTGRVQVPYVAKLDSNLNIVWERYYAKDGHGFTTYEAGWGSICPDGRGYVIMMHPYKSSGNNPIPWIIWTDLKGQIMRDVVLSGNGMYNTPVLQSGLLTDQCGLMLEGHMANTLMDFKKGIHHSWNGRLNSRGVMIMDSLHVVED